MTTYHPIEPDELETLRRLYGPFPVESVTLPVSEAFFVQGRTPIGTMRRAEVLLVLQAPDRRILLHTKRFYPPGVLRLPTGGIRNGESVEDALRREVKEETGLNVGEHRLLGVLLYDILFGEKHVPFASYVYWVRAHSKDVAPEDAEEEISAFRWVLPEELPRITEALRHVPPAWQDWSRFRRLGHEFVIRHWKEE